MAPKSNVELLAALDSAFKGITEISTLGGSVLQPEKFDRFVQQMEHSTTILPAARFIAMQSSKTDIDRTGFTGRILKSGRDTSEDVRVLATGEFSNPAFHTNQLNAQELQAVASLRDDALRRNLERDNFENTLIDLFAAAAGRDLEEYALLGDTELTYAQDDVLHLTDGWVRRAANKLYGVGSDKDFDPSITIADNHVEDMLDAMLQALPKQFFGNPNDWKYYVSWQVFDAYRNILKARGTVLGDTAQTSQSQLWYKGVQLIYAPVIERSASLRGEADADLIEGDLAILCNPDNMAWGIFHQVEIEREREAKARRTDFVLAFEGDADYEDENAVVVALRQKENPSGS